MRAFCRLSREGLENMFVQGFRGVAKSPRAAAGCLWKNAYKTGIYMIYHP
jgi:hypothetical protein